MFTTLALIAAMAAAIGSSAATVAVGSSIHEAIETRKEKEFKHKNPEAWYMWAATHMGQSLLPPQQPPLPANPTTETTEQLPEGSFGPDEPTAEEQEAPAPTAETTEETTDDTDNKKK